VPRAVLDAALSVSSACAVRSVGLAHARDSSCGCSGHLGWGMDDVVALCVAVARRDCATVVFASRSATCSRASSWATVAPSWLPSGARRFGRARWGRPPRGCVFVGLVLVGHLARPARADTAAVSVVARSAWQRAKKQGTGRGLGRPSCSRHGRSLWHRGRSRRTGLRAAATVVQAKRPNQEAAWKEGAHEGRGCNGTG
jgi:hypothetical protein